MHRPGVLGQSDFTHMDDLAITLGGIPFPHLICHFVFTYSNVEAIQLCFSESFEALAEGLEGCLWQLGGVPQQHRTDNLSAAVVRIDQGERQYTERYQALMTHYGMQPSTNQPGEAHENGESSKPTTASRRLSTRRSACTAAATLPIGRPMRASCRT